MQFADVEIELMGEIKSTREGNAEVSVEEQSMQLIQVSFAEYTDPFGPYQIQKKINAVMSQWIRVIPMNPICFLSKLLKVRGYDEFIDQPISSMDSRKTPTDKQLVDYDSEIIVAVRNSDMNKLKQLKEDGYSMAACNKFGESILHLACRRASFEVVEFLLNNGGDALAVDDFGRTPFHDACWRSDPRFDIISLLLQKDKSLLRYKDVRGSLGLNYVLEENWLQFCAFFFHQRDRYFPIVTGPDIAIESEKST